MSRQTEALGSKNEDSQLSLSIQGGALKVRQLKYISKQLVSSRANYGANGVKIKIAGFQIYHVSVCGWHPALALGVLRLRSLAACENQRRAVSSNVTQTEIDIGGPQQRSLKFNSEPRDANGRVALQREASASQRRRLPGVEAEVETLMAIINIPTSEEIFPKTFT